MATPTKTDLATLDYSYLGRPFCRVAAQTDLETATLDYAYLGQPFVGAMDATSGPSVAQRCALLGVHAVRRRRHGP